MKIEAKKFQKAEKFPRKQKFYKILQQFRNKKKLQKFKNFENSKKGDKKEEIFPRNQKQIHKEIGRAHV